MPLPDSVAALIENFARNRTEYHKGHYNETQTRIDYVNPLFAALGWDMDNQGGLSELHREVIHEDMVKIGGRSKAPDYSFRVGGQRKFFVETKKPSVNLYLLEAPAFQLRRYAWTVKMPLSILTNFEEFAVYDTRVRPDQKDAAKTARLEHFKYTDYAEKWDSLEARFSLEAVFSGAFDKYAAEAKDKRISVPVDQAFLSEISGWREKLARNIVQNNPALGPRELNYAVQMIIDRLIFLRISEDRGAEPDFLLQPLMNKGSAVYPRLLDIFRRADARYNSGLFHFEPDPKREGPDDVTPHLVIDDRPLREIIASVYYPESPFEFSVFPADILGQVYEQFLGKVIRVSGKTAEVEEKPEVKKAGGVYYTPTYIVDYIVKNTVGKLVEGKTPAQVAKLTILDPACGSGSFLIGAYQFLLDWHLRYYLENDRTKYAKGKNAVIYQFKADSAGGEIWRLTTAEKKRILLNNIYGVDIDTQAVEVSKLSLLLKVLEGESAELIDNSLKLYQERALPDLEQNIKCGNSLIGPDFYTDKDMALFDMDALLKINTFDWNKSFPKVMQSGGFDAVIGNPPYIDSEWMTAYHQTERDYCTNRYTSASGNWDIFCVFTQKAIDLCKTGGLSSMIVPNKLGAAEYAGGARTVLTVRNSLLSVRDYSKVPVFPVAVYPLVYVAEKTTSQTKLPVFFERMGTSADGSVEPQNTASLDYSRHFSLPNQPWEIFSGNLGATIVERMRKVGKPLSTIASVLGAATVGEAYLLKPLLSEQIAPKDKDIAVINSGTIDRYTSLWGEKPMRYLGSAILNPVVLDKDSRNLPPKRRKQANTAKIVVAGMTKSLECVLDMNGKVLAAKSTTIIFSASSLIYLLGVLNSRLVNFYFANVFGGNSLQGGYLRVGPPQLKTIPVPIIDFGKPAEKAKHDKMVGLVERMLKLHKDKAAARLTTEKTMLQTQIEATDTQIDKLVYDLYGLTEDEIKVVEGAG